MLAERKKRVKWTLNPRGNSWSQDTNKFGQRMLEKMGWKSGEGLGINKQGITEHIKVAYKNDNKCLGYKDNGEEWVEHQSQFESLLSELSGSHSTALDKTQETETLEQRARQSRTRVHYQKFTRGKDLSRYSEKDLKCILGKPKVNNADEDNEDPVEEHFDGFYGVRTINSGTMNDYFKKLTKANSSDEKFEEEGVNKKNDETEEQCGVRLKKKKKRNTEVEFSDSENCDIGDAQVALKQHEKKENCKLLEQLYSANNNEDSYTYCESVSKKRRKTKDVKYNADDAYVELDNDEKCQEEMRKKRKSNSKEDTESDLKTVTNLDDAIIMDTYVKLDHEKARREEKPKKRKNGSKEEVESELMNVAKNSDVIINDICSKLDHEKPCSEKKPKRKRKSRKEDPDGELNDIANNDAIINDTCFEELDYEKTHQEKKSKKRKNRNIEDVEVEMIDENHDETIKTDIHIERLDDEKTGPEKRYKKGRYTSKEDTEKVLKNDSDEIINDTHNELMNGKKCQSKKSKKRKNSSEEDSENVLKNDDENINETCTELVNEETCEEKKFKKGESRCKEDTENEIKGIADNGEIINNTFFVEFNHEEALQGKKLRKRKNCSEEDIETLLKKENDKIEHKKKKKKSKNKSFELPSEDKETEVEFNSLVQRNLAHNSEIVTFKCEAGKHTDLAEETKLADALPTENKKKMSLKEDSIEGLSAESTNDNSGKEQSKKCQKNRKDNYDNHNELLESIKEEEKENKGKCQDLANGGKEIMAEQLNEGGTVSPTSHKMYLAEEIKNMKAFYFAQLIDPKSIEFKGSNLHTIAGYGKG